MYSLLPWLIAFLVVVAPRPANPMLEELPGLATIAIAAAVTFIQYRRHVLPVLWAEEEAERCRVAAGEPPQYPTWGE